MSELVFQSETGSVEHYRVDATMGAKLNLADFQNAVPLLKTLSIANGTKDESKSLQLRIESTPAFIKSKLWRIDAVGAGSTFRIPDLDLQLDGPLLTRLTESETATVTLSLRQSDSGVELARLECAVELLPRNQWGICEFLDMWRQRPPFSF